MKRGYKDGVEREGNKVGIDYRHAWYSRMSDRKTSHACTRINKTTPIIYCHISHIGARLWV